MYMYLNESALYMDITYRHCYKKYINYCYNLYATILAIKNASVQQNFETDAARFEGR